MPDTLHPKADSNSPFRQGGMPTLKCAEGPGVIKPADVNPIRRESCCVTSASKEDSGHDVREASFLSTPGTELSTVSNIFSDYERDALTSDTEEESDDNDVAKGIASPTRCRRKISTYRVSSSNTSRHATANTDTVPSELSSESSASAHDNVSFVTFRGG
ncbi:hypothetical protein BDV29DRAFT_66356 [Aspergillus leporis]|jgi:hypothetical protein|uniref:Uncharacterized protein n=1 Tax=Aspergillus leporis TaxID=41062 RepID=A0A5N5WJ53_9EURO|nr:hypothetical protein BDV29DRAFT_66356 [Aspergillus leporis]